MLGRVVGSAIVGSGTVGAALGTSGGPGGTPSGPAVGLGCCDGEAAVPWGGVAGGIGVAAPSDGVAGGAAETDALAPGRGATSAGASAITAPPTTAPAKKRNAMSAAGAASETRGSGR